MTTSTTDKTIEKAVKSLELVYRELAKKETAYAVSGKELSAISAEDLIRTTTINEEFPAPWIIDTLISSASGKEHDIVSIISVGGNVDNTVISMVDRKTAEHIVQEVNNYED